MCRLADKVSEEAMAVLEGSVDRHLILSLAYSALVLSDRHKRLCSEAYDRQSVLEVPVDRDLINHLRRLRDHVEKSYRGQVQDLQESGDSKGAVESLQEVDDQRA